MHVPRDSILLIDDDQLIAGSLKMYLLTRWDVDVARDVPAAEKMMRERNYAVVVMDPYLTGISTDDRGALLSRARRLQPDAALIVLTGYQSSEMERAAADCHAAALISKPQSVLALGDAITSALHLRAPVPE